MNQNKQEQIIKILDKHFPDEMDSSMYHPHLDDAVEDIQTLLSQSRQEAVKEGYLKAFDEIKQNLQEEKHESRESGVMFALNATNHFLATNKLGCRLEYVPVGTADAKDIVFFNDKDNKGNEFDLGLLFGRKITQEMEKY